ncbi:MAG: inner-rane translocator [Chloroflexi bacterium]|nr:inner-rane translocator [Chloroflexota bacterium]
MQPTASPRLSRWRLGALVLALISGGEAGVCIALAALVVVFYLLNHGFLSEVNIRAMLDAVAYVGIIGVGQTVLLVAGEFDLSVGSVAGLCAVIAGWLMTTGHVPVALAVLGGLAAGALLGLINSIVVVRFGIPAFIATLGMLFVAQGLTQVITNGYPIYPLPDVVGNFGQATSLFGIGWAFVILLVLLVVGDFAMRRTTLGRNIYATGGNKEVARLVGINTNRYKTVCFMLVGMLAATAGMLVMGSLASATTSIGQGWELTVIAGVVVGGVSLFGGVGTVLGGAMGMLLLQVVQSGLVVVGVSANWQQVSVGVIMVLAVGLDVVRRKLSFRQVHSVSDVASLLTDLEVATERRTIQRSVGATDDVRVTTTEHNIERGRDS